MSVDFPIVSWDDERNAERVRESWARNREREPFYPLSFRAVASGRYSLGQINLAIRWVAADRIYRP